MNKYFKLVIAFLLLAGSVYMFSTREIAWGIILAILTAIPILLFFRNEFILLAFWKMRSGDLDGAKKWLDYIKNPTTQLVKKQFGYYHYMKGLTEGQNNLPLAEKYMRKALDYGLSFAHDRAMAKMNLAAGAMSRGRKQEAQRWLSEAKADDKQKMLAEQIKMFEGQMKKMNVGRNMQNPNMRNRGKFF